MKRVSTILDMCERGSSAILRIVLRIHSHLLHLFRPILLSANRRHLFRRAALALAKSREFNAMRQMLLLPLSLEILPPEGKVSGLHLELVGHPLAHLAARLSWKRSPWHSLSAPH